MAGAARARGLPLARLKTERIELYLLHRDDRRVPVGPIVNVLNEHLQAGKIGAFGGSNWSVERIQEANSYAAVNGLVPFVASSPNFSLAEQMRPPWPNCVSISGENGRADRDWYASQGMPLITWSSLAGGFFSGRFQRNALDQFEDGLASGKDGPDLRWREERRSAAANEDRSG